MILGAFFIVYAGFLYKKMGINAKKGAKGGSL
jgi:hypothetical protein